MESVRNELATQSAVAVVTKRIVGTVLWYDNVREFGFVSVSGYPDIHLSRPVLTNAGLDSIVEGATVVGLVEQTKRGWRITSLESVDTSTSQPTQSAPRPGRVRPALVPDSDWVKVHFDKFNSSRGYGFVKLLDSSGQPDIFIHITAFQTAKIEPADVLNSILEVRFSHTAQGRKVAEVRLQQRI